MRGNQTWGAGLRPFGGGSVVHAQQQWGRGRDGGHAFNERLSPKLITEDFRLSPQMGNCFDYKRCNERWSVLVTLLPFSHSVPRTLLLFGVIKCVCVHVCV